jgi:hypothetical protein
LVIQHQTTKLVLLAMKIKLLLYTGKNELFSKARKVAQPLFARRLGWILPVKLI